MTLIDTHTHLYLDEFDGQGADAVKRAINAGVTQMIFPNVDLSTIKPMEELASMFSDNIHVAMGFHPTEVNNESDDALEQIVALINERHDRYVAVGEIGMDLYWDKTFCDKQMLALERQSLIAKKFRLPIIIHCREALAQTVEVLSGVKYEACVFHSFGGTTDDVDFIRKHLGDVHFGVNGIITFKNSKLKQTLPAIGKERIVLETDSPYLAPAPNRGKRNESAYIVYTAHAVADALGLDVDTVAQVTTDNAKRFFKI
jgi:TatD DNase family protein